MYEAESYDEMSKAPLELQKRYNENQKYLYNLKKWIIELKSKIKNEYYVDLLKTQNNNLTMLENGDLARSTKQLNQIELRIREIITDYNDWIKEKQTSNPKDDNILSQPLVKEGYNFQNKGEFSDAIYNYSQFLKTNEKNVDVLFLRAMCKSELGDKYGAISDYDKILNLKNDTEPTIFKISTVLNNKAYCLINLKKYTEALPFVNEALSIDKSEAYIWDTRGELYYNLGEFKKCIDDMNEALLIEENANSYYFRALSLVKLNEKQKACLDFSKAGELGEKDAYKMISKYCNQ